MLRTLRYYGGKFVRARYRKEADSYLRLCEDCRGTQKKTLARILGLNAASRYSRERGLTAGLSIDEFRKRHDVGDFEAVRPYVEELRLGRTDALLGPENPLLMFALSSGTTAEAKYIPITDPFLADYRRGWKVWGVKAFDAHEAVNQRNIVQITSNHDQFRTPGGTPCGNISGLVSKMQSRIVRSMYTLPLSLTEIPHADLKTYAALRIALANPHIGLVMTANPSTLVQWAQLAEARRDDMIRDIADGTLTGSERLAPELRATLARSYSRPNRKRAQQLERLVCEHGSLRPADAWPSLALAAVWTGGSVGFYLPAMRRAYGNIPVRDHGLSASEGRMTIPLDDETSSGVLDIGSHFFEFIPEEEYGHPQPTILEAHELIEGRHYYVLLTTCSGLYRYDIRDVVRCTGYYRSAPLLQFLHKGAHISNLTGEKISESQVVEAVRHSAQSLRLDVDCFTMAPVWGEPPRYRLHIEHPAGSVPRLHLKDFVAAIDDRLQELNCEYREKRQTGRLAPADVAELPEGTWHRFRTERQSRPGGSAEQYKHPCLVPDLKFSDRLSS